MRNYLLEYIVENGYPNGCHLRNMKHKNFIEELREETSFLDEVYDNISDSTRAFCILYDIYEAPLCESCGDYTKVGPGKDKKPHYNKMGFRQFCSNSCSTKGTSEKRKDSYRNKTGYDHPMHNPEVVNKVSSTNEARYGAKCYIASEKYQKEYMEMYEEKYGYVHHLANPDVIKKREEGNTIKHGHSNPFVFARDKILSSMNEKYGVDNPMKSEEIRERAKDTNKERYGFEFPLQSPVIKQKIEASYKKYKHGNPMRDHYSDETWSILTDRELLKDMYEKTPSARELASILGVGSHKTILNALHAHEIDVPDIRTLKQSQGEKEICQFLDDNGIQYEIGNRDILNPKEIDIFIHEYNVAIEYNGIYWHSSYFKSKRYHQDKSLNCMNKGILLLHVYEDQWKLEHSKNVIKEKILQKCGVSTGDRVYARKCNVSEISVSVADSFNYDNHIQGVNSCSINYALYHDEEIVAVMGLKVHNGYHDLVRYSTSCNVVGGFSKLLSHFKKNNEWSKIITYANLDYSHGDVYEKCGFTKVAVTEPNYHYMDDMTRLSRQKFMKGKLEGKLDNYDESLTEKENMLNHGFLILYDSGSIKYTLSK